MNAHRANHYRSIDRAPVFHTSRESPKQLRQATIDSSIMQNSSARRLSLAARARYGLMEHGPWPLVALAAIVANGAAGLAVHFEMLAFRSHLETSALTVIIVAWTAIQAIRRNMDELPVRRAAMLLLSLTCSQVLLGVGSYMNMLVPDTLPWFPIAHATCGVATFGAAVALSVLVYRRTHPEDEELAHGGVAIA
jgi:hypothetical protein